MTRYTLSANPTWLNAADAAVRDRYIDSARSHAEKAGQQIRESAHAVDWAGRHEVNILRREGEEWVERMGSLGSGSGRGRGMGRGDGWPETVKSDSVAFKPLVLKSQQRAAQLAAAAPPGSGSSNSSKHMADGFYSIGHRLHGRSTGLGGGREGGGQSWVDQLKHEPGAIAGIVAADAALVAAGVAYGVHREREKSRTREKSRSRKGTGVYEPPR
ncbi:hypothetical protein JCM11251_005868 [Rhodosporidiobolus azoricus]